MKNTKKSRRLPAALLALVMTFGLLPAMTAPAYAAGSAEVFISYQDDVYIIPKQLVTVSPDLSDTYGYDDVITGVSALDALIAAHKIYFDTYVSSGAFSTWLEDALKVSGGYASKVFDKSASYFTFLVNGKAPVDGLDLLLLSEALVSDYGYVEFLIYQDNWLMDYYTWFEDENGRVDNITVEINNDKELFLKGDMPISNMWDPAYEFDGDTMYDLVYAEDLTIVILDPVTGDVVDELDIEVDDDDGGFTISFDAEGTYILSALGDKDEDAFIFSPWLEITVTSDTPAPTPTPTPEPTPAPPAGGVQIDWRDALENALCWLKNNTPEPKVSATGGEWAVLALARAGVETQTDPWALKYLAALDAELAKTGASALSEKTDRERAALAVTALGLNAANYKGTDLTAAFKDNPGSDGLLNGDIYALIALDSKGYDGDASLYTGRIIGSQNTDGSWSLSAAPSATSLVDITAMALQALAPHYGDPIVKIAADKAAAYLKTKTNLSVFSAAQVIVAFTALGEDPPADALDDLLRAYNISTGSFGVNNVMATEQAAYALVAYYRHENGLNTLYDMRDAGSPIGITVGSGPGGGAGSGPNVPPGGINATISIGSWVSGAKYNFLSGSVTVYDVFTEAVREFGLTQIGAENNYVKSINGLAEFAQGPNSGWIYKVNGVFPDVGLKDYVIKNNDVIVWSYASDYTMVPGFSGGGGGGAPQPAEKKDEAKPGETAQSGGGSGVFSDIKSGDWFYEAVKYVSENGLMNGTGNGFEPNTPLTRAMLITILARAGGVDTTGGETWYSDAAAWGVATGITDGLNLSGNITREQFVTMLFRFTGQMGLDTSARADIEGFADAGDISDWAKEAMEWAYATGLMTGRTASELTPGGPATRAEAATLLQRFMENIVK
ncbi:MAG: S-layer homology domain-containing protein [Oscillospiraceae bacterium]|nr:S-layer homology domain-containing protein [Oscillospiraceae bacterium]